MLGRTLKRVAPASAPRSSYSPSSIRPQAHCCSGKLSWARKYSSPSSHAGVRCTLVERSTQGTRVVARFESRSLKTQIGRQENIRILHENGRQTISGKACSKNYRTSDLAFARNKSPRCTVLNAVRTLDYGATNTIRRLSYGRTGVSKIISLQSDNPQRIRIAKLLVIAIAVVMGGRVIFRLLDETKAEGTEAAAEVREPKTKRVIPSIPEEMEKRPGVFVWGSNRYIRESSKSTDSVAMSLPLEQKMIL
jgi:hypothetical protein